MTAHCFIFFALGTALGVAASAAWLRCKARSTPSAERAAWDARRLEAYEVAIEDFSRAAWSVRDVFDHLGAYVPLDPNIDRMLHVVSQYAAWRMHDVPRQLACWNGEGAHPTGTSWDNDKTGQISHLVEAINDPVLAILWESRTPQDLADMLRHGLFLAFGWPHAVTPSTLEGVNVTFPSGKVMFNGADEYSDPSPLRQRCGRMWRDWQDRQRESCE